MMLEICLGTLAACLPTLRGLFRTGTMESMAKNMRTAFSINSTSWRGSSKGSRGDSMDESLRSKEDIVMKPYVQTSVTQV